MSRAVTLEPPFLHNHAVEIPDYTAEGRAAASLEWHSLRAVSSARRVKAAVGAGAGADRNAVVASCASGVEGRITRSPRTVCTQGRLDASISNHPRRPMYVLTPPQHHTPRLASVAASHTVFPPNRRRLWRAPSAPFAPSATHVDVPIYRRRASRCLVAPATRLRRHRVVTRGKSGRSRRR